jgi:hypothetical protein
VWSWLSAATNAVRYCVGVSEALQGGRASASLSCHQFLEGDVMMQLATYTALAVVMSLVLLSLTMPTLVLPF